MNFISQLSPLTHISIKGLAVMVVMGVSGVTSQA